MQGEFGYSRLSRNRSRPCSAGAAIYPCARRHRAGDRAGPGVALGALAASRSTRAPLVDAIAVIGQAMPTFWLGILLIIAFAVTLGWLPAGGTADHGLGLAYLVLPVATLAAAHLASYARHSPQSSKHADRTLDPQRPRPGRAESRVLLHHAFPNAALPVLQIAALDAGALAGGALVTETVFARPGMGKLLYDAVMGNDTNLALIALLLVALVTMLATLGADLAQRALDPRLRER